jgi:hypothetical protein
VSWLITDFQVGAPLPGVLVDILYGGVPPLLECGGVMASYSSSSSSSSALSAGQFRSTGAGSARDLTNCGRHLHNKRKILTILKEHSYENVCEIITLNDRLGLN